MPRPQVVVSLAAALPRRGSPSATGTAMFAFSGGTGPTTPKRVTSPADVTALYGVTAPIATLAAQVGDALALGAPEVVLVKVVPTAPATTPTEAEWTAGLSQLTDEFNAAGQVAIPGVALPAAHSALVAHAAARPARTVFLDAADDADAATLTALAATHTGATAAARVGIIAPAVSFPGAAGTARLVPGSVVAAGLVGRGDARAGHPNNAPAFLHSGGAGVVTGGIAVARAYTDSERDTLHDAGVSVIVMEQGRVVLFGWRSVSTDARFRQLNWGRLAGGVTNDMSLMGKEFLGLPLGDETYDAYDGRLRGYFERLYRAGALFGSSSDDAYEVAVHGVQTPASIVAGDLRAVASLAFTPHIERVSIAVTTSIAGRV